MNDEPQWGPQRKKEDHRASRQTNRILKRKGPIPGLSELQFLGLGWGKGIGKIKKGDLREGNARPQIKNNGQNKKENLLLRLTEIAITENQLGKEEGRDKVLGVSGKKR